ncbi:MAG: hypothetical protein QQN65_07670, partial [Nitrosopumilus sp.]
ITGTMCIDIDCVIGEKSKKFFILKSFDTQAEREVMLGKLMLVVLEVSKSSETVRKNDFIDFTEKLGDTFINLFVITKSMDIDIVCAIGEKMIINDARPILHGKMTTL